MDGKPDSPHLDFKHGTLGPSFLFKSFPERMFGKVSLYLVVV